MPKAKTPPPTRRTQSTQTAPAKPATADDLRGELRQLATIRAKFQPLDPLLAASLLAQHDDASCRARGDETHSAATFRGAMNCARTVGEHANDAGIHPAQVRWFLDCLTALGTHLTGAAPSANPVDAGRYADAGHAAEVLLARVTRKLRGAVGTNPAWNAALDTALTPDGVLDERLSRLRGLADLVRTWTTKPMAGVRLISGHAPAPPPAMPPLAAYGIDEGTRTSLVTAADALDEAIAHRPAPKQFDHDSPEVNAAEGRVFFAMRSLWDELAEARDDGRSQLQLPVTSTLLRGMNVHRHHPKAAPAAPPAAT